ncbi:protoporphyrinogen/coproporphyrinogen oxidase [Pseudonocardia sp. Cha107L01]|uniref:protoporphyrinogen/coproporphyrinogen oxidase n=1 Tax=Pseudonocardia sp. Cha107L01 TaxID=3457576 RepID=UPI00403E8DD9
MSGTESSIVAGRRVAVVGAGAAGISAAFWLRRAGAHVRVLEAGEQVGGRCRTVERDGFRFDISAGALPSTYADLLRLLDALGVRHEIELRGAVIGALRDGAVHRIARRNPLSFLSARHIPAKDKASLWRLGLDLGRMFRSINYHDLGTAARFDVETMHDYCTRHYPDSVRDNLLEPITRALLLVEPEQSSVVDLFAACRSLLLAGHILTHSEGVGFFLQRAAQHLDVSLGAVVDRVDETEDGVEVHWSDARGTQLERFDAAVLALPAEPTLTIHPELDPVRRKYLENLRYSTSVVVSLGVAPAPAETASMVLIPRDIEPDLAVVGLGHNLGAHRAPAGAGVLTAYWMSSWSERHLGDTDEEIVAVTRATINRLLPGWADDVRASVVSRWRPALVASEVGTYAGLVDFHAHTDPAARIQLAGDYHAQTSVNASVAAGAQAAERLINTLHLH